MNGRLREAATLSKHRRGSGVMRLGTASGVAGSEEQQRAAPGAEPAPATLELVLGSSAATLIASCPVSRDCTGAVLEAVCASGARVVEAEQHLDPDADRLFQRVRADISWVPGGAPEFEARVVACARRAGVSTDVKRAERRQRLAIFVSKYDHCLYDLLLRHQAGELDCEISVIVSNHPDLGRVAHDFGVDYEVVPKTAQNKREAEAREGALLDDRGTDLVVLARYMQIMSDEFVTSRPNRVINIHHSFLPAFIGAKPYHQAAERGVKLVGATAHYATAALDEGPIIEQDVARCTHKDTVADLVRKGKDLEKQVLARAVRWHLDHRVVVHDRRTIVFD
jgi:formyltetrahydrofolate deformylase